MVVIPLVENALSPQRLPMQTILVVNERPETYVERRSQTRLRPPGRCGRCGGGLKAHGYYSRHTTGARGQAVRIQVRRFRCRRCAATVSCLPSFAQPYHFVSNLTIQRAFAGHGNYRDVRRNRDLLRRYWACFEQWSRRLWRVVWPFGQALSLRATARDVWRRLSTSWQNLATCTQRLVHEFQVTCFGQYLCHRR